MSKVLASLKPYFYYLVGEEIKKIEVRKSEPKAKDWDRNVLFYMSKDEKSFAKIPKEFQEKYRKHFGKVGLKFICDRIDEYAWVKSLPKISSETGLPSGSYNSYLIFDDDYEKMCLSYDEVKEYGNGRTLYGWHISDLKIYDEPKEINEFWTVKCSRNYKTCFECKDKPNCIKTISRPFQSWGYVEI